MILVPACKAPPCLFAGSTAKQQPCNVLVVLIRTAFLFTAKNTSPLLSQNSSRKVRRSQEEGTALWIETIYSEVFLGNIEAALTLLVKELLLQSLPPPVKLQMRFNVQRTFKEHWSFYYFFGIGVMILKLISTEE